MGKPFGRDLIEADNYFFFGQYIFFQSVVE
jgi:hypothetical protein